MGNPYPLVSVIWLARETIAAMSAWGPAGTSSNTSAKKLANADSEATEPGKEPYRRKIISFRNVLDREIGANIIKADRIRTDNSEFGRRFDPNHPAADENGYVLRPNINALIEIMDMREAQRSYEANLNAIRSARTMAQQTIRLLR